MRELTLLSLFSGSGGFEFAGALCGIHPVACSEVEPYPIAVTRSRFPSMKHLGSVTDIRGDKMDPVNVLTWGFPCQDCSVAGKRAGIKHTENGDDQTTRSGLMFEAIRTIREMQSATNGEYPQFMIVENVPGLLSVDGGEGFKLCLDLIQDLGFLVDPNILDAQYMGVPQRRKRVYLVCVNMKFVMRNKSTMAKAVSLQLLSELLRINLANILVRYDIPVVKNKVLNLRVFADGYIRRRQLFSLAETSSLLQLKGILGDAQMCGILDRVIDDGEKLLKDEQSANPIEYKVGNYLSDMLTVHKAAVAAMEQLSNASPKDLNYYEWILWAYEEMRGFINASKKYAKQLGQLVWDDILRDFECKLCSEANSVEQYFGDQCAKEIPFEPESMRGYPPQSTGARENAACPSEAGAGAADHPFASGLDGYNSTLTGDAAATLGVNCGMSTGRNGVLVELNDVAGFKAGQGSKAHGIGWQEDIAPTLAATPSGTNQVPAVCYGIGAHNSKGMLSDNPKVGFYEAETSRTLDLNGGNPTCNQGGIAVVEPAYCLQGSMIGRADKNGPQGSGISEDVSFTLNTIDRPAVAYLASGKDTVGTLLANAGSKLWLGNQEAFSGDYHILESCEQQSFYNNGIANYTEECGTLRASGGDCGGGAENLLVEREPTVPPQYLVRRLTPTECARLQGFPDFWGHPDHKEKFSEEEYQFWLTVRNTHAKINGKAEKKYTNAQMLSWYNSLHSDGSEYKMWGNGIALPCALFVMSEIAAQLKGNM